MIFGDMDSIFGITEGQLGNQYFVMTRILYIAFTFTVSLILLNMLIAIMGNSFNQIQAY